MDSRHFGLIVTSAEVLKSNDSFASNLSATSRAACIHRFEAAEWYLRVLDVHYVPEIFMEILGSYDMTRWKDRLLRLVADCLANNLLLNSRHIDKFRALLANAVSCGANLTAQYSKTCRWPKDIYASASVSREVGMAQVAPSWETRMDRLRT